MKIIADDRIPFLRGVLEKFAEVVYLPGSAVTASDVADADALIVRTRTKCNSELLSRSNVRCVATATIGYDHIDVPAVENLGIRWSNAPGCNAGSVKNYIASALAVSGTDWRGKTLGIIGVGNVGRLVAQVGEAFGMNVLLNDPPREEKEGAGIFTGLDELLAQSDVVTLHVPLERSGSYPTLKMADRAFFAKMKSGASFFNSCRGEVVDVDAFLEAKKSGKISCALMDVWPGEPDIAPELLEAVNIGTPHIAGYSVDGKANGTAAAVRFVAGVLNIPDLAGFKVSELPPPEYAPEIIIPPGRSPYEAVRQAVLHAYDIRRDAGALQNAPQDFELLRGKYWKRREFAAYTVSNAPVEAEKNLQLLGFKTGKGKTDLR